MVIGGIQKLTLLDYPQKVACIVFTSGCDLRCPFCHNTPLLDGSAYMDEEETVSFLKKRAAILDGVVISGGEPLLHKDLKDFMKKIKDMGYLVKLDTNGTHPERLKEIADQKLADYIAMDIKNSPEKYALTVGAENFDIKPIEESVKIIMQSGGEYEFRTTVVKELHSVSDFDKIGMWIKGARAYYIQSFKDSGNIFKPPLSSPEAEFLQQALDTVKKYVPNASLRGTD